MYSGYSGHVYSGHSDIVATLPGTKYINSIIFRSDIVANQIKWPERWPLYRKCTVPTCWYPQREILGLGVLPNARPNASIFALQ